MRVLLNGAESNALRPVRSRLTYSGEQVELHSLNL